MTLQEGRISLAYGNVRLWMRRDGHEFQPYVPTTTDEGGWIGAPFKLEPKDFLVSREVIFHYGETTTESNPSGFSVFDKPGEYTFQVKYRPFRKGQSLCELQSNEVEVKVTVPQGKDELALQFQNEHSLTRLYPGSPFPPGELFSDFSDFLLKYPKATYTPYLKVYLIRYYLSHIRYDVAQRQYVISHEDWCIQAGEELIRQQPRFILLDELLFPMVKYYFTRSDQGATKTAKKHLSRLVENYPWSPYYQESLKWLKRLDNSYNPPERRID